MKTPIYYFSGTGNCLKIARELADELGDAEVISIAKAAKSKVDVAAERIGIVFPVYALNMPAILFDFISKMEADASKYIFGVMTYADVGGDALIQLARELRRKGLKLSAGFGIRMPGNYTPFYGAIPVEKQLLFFNAAHKRIVEEIAPAIREGRIHKIERSKFPLNLLTWALYPLVLPMTPSEDKKFWADERCNGCGICQKVCPVDNIRLQDGRPSWKHRCVQCFACLQWCPTQALQFGKSTKGRKRYHHPEAVLQDFINSERGNSAAD
ncbi:MAG: EFR1 family ferrodoxin [Candidatus Omnitrophica bacterium]|nr:EFR1 family ferrodoxin [Candidatus Omnitrophota bacterium]MBU1869043.1 EFR1 family ferrodoxin [Candidatus Omnitrophota bacterium]